MNGRDPAQARAEVKARFRRGMYLLPSLFTVGNIAAAFFRLQRRSRRSAAMRRRTWTGRRLRLFSRFRSTRSTGALPG